MTLHDPGDPLEGAADITTVQVRCESCGGAWEEFRATADTFHRPADDATPPIAYVSSKKDCVFCNETPGDYIRGGKWRKPPP
ncbi:MAG: hypothetical protein AAB502_05635 [Chloroflexota bacterium]